MIAANFTPRSATKKKKEGSEGQSEESGGNV